MIKEFQTIHPEASIKEVARMIYEAKARETGYKSFGIMVVNEIDQLIGMVSMHDILYHLRPPIMNYALESIDMWRDELESYLCTFKKLTVEQVMTTPPLTVSPEDHWILLIDKMLKRKTRRLPVVDGDKILGIVYLSDVFYHLCEDWIKEDTLPYGLFTAFPFC